MSGEFLLVIKDKGQRYEEIHYCGTDEIQAQKKYKKLEGCQRIMARANVRRQLVSGTPFIMDYDVIEIIK